MSKKQQSFLLTAPLFAVDLPVEKEEFFGFPCSTCGGSGWHWGEDERGDRTKIDCRVCQGSGKLKAVVTVEWSAQK